MPWDGDPPRHDQAHLDLGLDPCLGHELHLDLLNELLYHDQMKESLALQPRRNQTNRLNITIMNTSQVLYSDESHNLTSVTQLNIIFKECPTEVFNNSSQSFKVKANLANEFRKQNNINLSNVLKLLNTPFLLSLYSPRHQTVSQKGQPFLSFK